MNSKFYWQSFFSIGLLLSFIMIVLSGIILYVAPEGSLSRWIDWDVLGLSKKQWEHQHTIFSYLFIIFSVFHIFRINWGILLTYFSPEKFRIKYLREIIASSLICIAIFIGTLFDILPFNKVIELGDIISDSHSNGVEMPILKDSEKLSLNEFSENVLRSEYEKVELVLRGLKFSSIRKDILVKDICKINNVSPEDFYKILKGEFYKADN